MLQLSIALEGLLICLFTAYQEVSSFRDCEYNWSLGDWICKPEHSSWGSPSWFLPVVIIVPTLIAFGCCLTICISCCKSCRTRGETGPTEQPTVRVSIPPPVFTVPMPSAPPVNQCVEPPPYTEVAWKPYAYPPPVGQPPAYDNIAMDSPLYAYRPQR